MIHRTWSDFDGEPTQSRKKRSRIARATVGEISRVPNVSGNFNAVKLSAGEVYVATLSRVIGCRGGCGAGVAVPSRPFVGTGTW